MSSKEKLLDLIYSPNSFPMNLRLLGEIKEQELIYFIELLPEIKKEHFTSKNVDLEVVGALFFIFENFTTKIEGWSDDDRTWPKPFTRKIVSDIMIGIAELLESGLE